MPKCLFKLAIIYPNLFLLLAPLTINQQTNKIFTFGAVALFAEEMYGFAGLQII